ncbi:MAG: hypothetical protein Q9157_000790 [Trypethelium eluteriae]
MPSKKPQPKLDITIGDIVQPRLYAFVTLSTSIGLGQLARHQRFGGQWNGQMGGRVALEDCRNRDSTTSMYTPRFAATGTSGDEQARIELVTPLFAADGSAASSPASPSPPQTHLHHRQGLYHRVGPGLFPTKQLYKPSSAVDTTLQSVGHRKGVTSGGKWRCGWLDLVLVKYSCAINHYALLSLTKLDALDVFYEVKVAVVYNKGGKTEDVKRGENVLLPAKKDVKRIEENVVEHVYVVPGNAGTAALYKASNRADTASDDYPGLVVLAKNLQIGLVVVGPDRAVVDGIEGYFRQSELALSHVIMEITLTLRGGIPCFAPTKEAAELEGSKSFAKDFMRRHNIPTARYENFNDLEAAKRHVLQIGYRVVIKASGLAAGKGVILPSSTYEAVKALEDILGNRVFGAAGSSVVVEECLEGQEISIHTLSDGTHTWSFPPGQDHKRVHDGDRGLNTGGMGVYTPTPFVTPPMMQDIETLILEPTFEGLRLEGRTFVGCLFSGVMLTSSGPKVLEYNTRFGDPETQSMIPLLDETTGLAEVFLACTQGKLDQVSIKTVPAFACNVVVAARGYPQSYSSGETIEIGKSDTGNDLITLESS